MDENWEVLEEIDADTGVVNREYRYRGRLAKRVVLQSRLASHLAAYSLMEKDLRSVCVWLRAIESLHNEGIERPGMTYLRSDDRERYNLIKGLFVAALTFYGKCFTKGSGRAVTLSRGQVSPELRDTHDECMKFRHNFAAHAGGEDLEDSKAALVITDEDFNGLMIFRELRQPDLLWAGDKEDSFLALAADVHSAVERKIEKINEKIIQTEILPRGRDYWVGLAE